MPAPKLSFSSLERSEMRKIIVPPLCSMNSCDGRKSSIGLSVACSYVLRLNDGSIAYVGQTTNLKRRISAHRYSTLKGVLFDVFWIPETDLKKRLSMEAAMIDVFSPTLNKKNERVHLPMTEADILSLYSVYVNPFSSNPIKLSDWKKKKRIESLATQEKRHRKQIFDLRDRLSRLEEDFCRKFGYRQVERSFVKEEA